MDPLKYSFENNYLKVTYAEETHSFEMLFFGAPFLGNKMLGRVGKSEARLLQFTVQHGRDSLGEYEEVALLFESEKKSAKTFSGHLRFYDQFVIVEVINHFAMEEKKNKHLFGHPYISFPCFEGEEWQDGLSMLSFKRQAPFNYPEQWQGKVTDSPRDGKNTPLLLTNSIYQTVIVSPLNHLLYGTVSISKEPRALRCGLPRALKEIPQNTAYKTLIVYGKGVAATMAIYGEVLRKEYNMEVISKTADASLKYISYWTNAGSAYWYNAYKRTTYEQTLRKLKEHHDKIGLKIGLYQLDSWWYKRDGNHYLSSITEWEPKEIVESKNFNSMFPFLRSFKKINLFTTNRLSYVQSLLGKPIGTHFKQISNHSKYIKGNLDEHTTSQIIEATEQSEVREVRESSGLGELTKLSSLPQFEFIKEEFAVPKDYENAYGFFKQIFNHPKWRLSLLIHDWLNLLALNHSAFSDITIGPAYFKGLDDALIETHSADNEVDHLTMQLCMELPSITLHAITMKSVTSLRSTSDSNSFMIEGTKRWWWHLYSSFFINAMGKYSFFDNRFSYKTHIHPFSSYSKLELIWLALSCGPIGLGDSIGKENMALINRVVNTAGEIIKPDHPCVPLDKCFLYNPHQVTARKGVTIYTSSTINTYQSFYLLSFNCHPYGRTVQMEFSLGEIDGFLAGPYIMYDYFTKTVIPSNEERLHLLQLKRRQFFYHIIAPFVNQRAVIGDVSKHVSLSSQIITNYSIEMDHIEVTLKYTAASRCQLVIYANSKPTNVYWDHFKVEERRAQLKHWTYDAKNCLITIVNQNIPEGEYRVKVVFAK